MENTSGFYKYEEPSLHHGPNFVYDSEFQLVRENIAEYQASNLLPINGWYWFDSIEDARIFFEIPEPGINTLGDTNGTA